MFFYLFGIYACMGHSTNMETEDFFLWVLEVHSGDKSTSKQLSSELGLYFLYLCLCVSLNFPMFFIALILSKKVVSYKK